MVQCGKLLPIAGVIFLTDWSMPKPLTNIIKKLPVHHFRGME